MKHGQFGHFLVYHLLPILLGYGALLALIGLLLYFYKRKKGKAKQDETRQEMAEMPPSMKYPKMRRKKKRKNR